MQVGILRQLRDGSAITTKVAEVLRAAREAEMRVVFLRHLSLPKELMGVAQLRQAPLDIVLRDCGMRSWGDAFFTTVEMIAGVLRRAGVAQRG